MKRVLITGANSYVGTNVEAWLKKTPDEFEVDTVSTFDGEWKKADFTKYDVVFHVAGIAHVDAKKKMEPLYRRVNTGLTLEIAAWAKEHGIKQFIFMSSSIVYKESKSLKPTIIDKYTVPSPNGFYGDSKLQADIGLQAMESNNFKVCIVRPPMIYGPNCKGNFMRLAKLGTVTPIFPKYANERSMLYIDNLAEFIKQAILRELSGIYHPQNKEYACSVEIAKAFAALNNHKLHVWRWLNVFVYLGSPFILSINKVFADYKIDMSLSEYGFDYQLVNQVDSFKRISLEKASLTHMN